MATEQDSNTAATSEVDEFASAFEEAASAAAPAPGEKPTEEAKPAELSPDEKAAAEKAAQEAADKAARDAAEKLARESAEKIAREAADKTAQEKAEAEAKTAAEIKDPVLTEDDQKVLAAFEKDWADVKPAVDILVRHAVAATEAKVARSFQALITKIYEDMAPLANSVNVVSSNSLRQAVLQAHADYDEIYPKLADWIKSQPAYLADGMNRVYTDGNAEEISDLVKRYKEANGVKPKEPNTAPEGPATTTTTPAAPAARPSAAAAVALKPVNSARTTPTPRGVDSQDFNAAFDEAAAAAVR